MFEACTTETYLRVLSGEGIAAVRKKSPLAFR
jgi:hypothetical protein